jgi:undecaprenyl diphosphate synthase
VDDVTVDLISQNLYAPEVPPLDLLVRTSGEQRISNFMLWRSAYSEIMFIEKLWPDMKKADIIEIIEQFSKRVRRFGK